MLYSCIRMATVGVKGLTQFWLVSAELAVRKSDRPRCAFLTQWHTLCVEKNVAITSALSTTVAILRDDDDIYNDASSWLNTTDLPLPIHCFVKSVMSDLQPAGQLLQSVRLWEAPASLTDIRPRCRKKTGLSCRPRPQSGEVRCVAEECCIRRMDSVTSWALDSMQRLRQHGDPRLSHSHAHV